MNVLTRVILFVVALAGAAPAFAQESELASKLSGATLIYHYSTGLYEGFRFSFTFDETSLTYQALNIEGSPVSPQYAYKAVEVGDGLYLVAWLQPDDTHISLLIDSNSMAIYNSMVWGPDQRAQRPDTWGIHVGEIEQFRFADE